MGNKRYRIALLIDYILSEYSNLLIDGIKAACKDLDIELYIFPVGELRNVKNPFDYQYVSITGLLKAENIDGIVFAAGTQMHYMTKAELSSYLKSYRSLPLVSISIEIPGINSIVVDCEAAYSELITNLVQVQGCKRFGIMGVKSNSQEVKARIKNIKSVLEENGIDPSSVTMWKSSFDYGATLNELETYYKIKNEFPFDAILSLNDEMAFACIDFCHKINLRVPEDVVVAGFDDVDRGKVTSPTLTTINQRIYDQGYESVVTLNKVFHDENMEKVTRVNAQTVIRESTSRHRNKKIKSDFIKYELTQNRKEFENIFSTEWYEKRAQMFQINRFYTEMQYDMSQEQLRHRLNSDMKSFGIDSMAIVLFDTPIEMASPFDYFTMPKKGKVFCGYDYATGFDSNESEEIRFNPFKRMLPPGLLSGNSEGLYVSSLFHNTLQYGYIIFKRGSYEVSVYDLLTKIIATIISSVYSFALANNEHTKFQAKYAKLDIIANTDELTGLYNRRGLYEIGKTALNFSKAMNQKGLIVYCDMDGLKKINDNFGHEAGDRAILAESIILKGNFRSNDIVSRIGGDEFVIISPGLDLENFERIKKQIDDDCAMWTESNNDKFVLSISMGYIEYPSEKVGYQITPLLSEADSVLYLEKRKKKARQEK